MILDFRFHNLYANDMVCRVTLCSDDTTCPSFHDRGAFLKYFGIPVAFTWFMSTKLLMVKALWIFEVCHCLCTATKADLCRKKRLAETSHKKPLQQLE